MRLVSKASFCSKYSLVIWIMLISIPNIKAMVTPLMASVTDIECLNRMLCKNYSDRLFVYRSIFSIGRVIFRVSKLNIDSILGSIDSIKS